MYNEATATKTKAKKNFMVEYKFAVHGNPVTANDHCELVDTACAKAVAGETWATAAIKWRLTP